jgi:hypothetical protein
MQSDRFNKHMDYACLMLGSAARNQIKKLRVLQPKYMRNATNAPWSSFSSSPLQGLHNKPQGCGTFVAPAAGPFSTKTKKHLGTLVTNIFTKIWRFRFSPTISDHWMRFWTQRYLMQRIPEFGNLEGTCSNWRLTKVAWGFSRKRLEVSRPVEVMSKKAAKSTQRNLRSTFRLISLRSSVNFLMLKANTGV